MNTERLDQKGEIVLPQPTDTKDRLAFAAISHFLDYPESIPSSFYRSLGIATEPDANITAEQREMVLGALENSKNILAEEVPETIQKQIANSPKKSESNDNTAA